MPELVPAAPRAPVAAERVNARLRGAARTAFPFLVVGAAWEAVAHAGLFPPRLFPPLELAAWPDQDHASRLVFITRNIPQEQVLALLQAVRGLAAGPPTQSCG